MELVNLDSEQYSLNLWECDFINSIEKQVRLGKTLSEKQKEKVSKLWDDAFIHKKRSFK